MSGKQRKTALRVAGWILAVAVVVFVSRSLVDGLRDLANDPMPRHWRWDIIAASGALSLVGHVVLVQTWRSMLGCWGEHLPFWSAARVWSVSNLGKYVPGKVWQIGAMSAMSQELGISPIVAPAAALLSTLVSLITGSVVALASGRDLLERVQPGWAALATAIAALSSLALVAAPYLVPRLAPVIARVTGRPLETTLPARAVVYSVVGTVAAWLLYGAAFELLVLGLLGRATGGYLSYLAAYTVSYLFGYLAIFAPAGLGARELAMKTVLTAARLMSTPEAALITIGSRVWLTVLEVTPALIFWVHYRMRSRSPTTDPSDGPT